METVVAHQILLPLPEIANPPVMDGISMMMRNAGQSLMVPQDKKISRASNRRRYRWAEYGHRGDGNPR
jgi:hypothetical protein